MLVEIVIAVFALIGLILFVAGVRKFWRRRPVAGSLQSVVGLALITAAGASALVAIGLRGYHRLSAEQHVAEITFAACAPQQFQGSLRYASGASESFELRGDEWQIDARVLKWRPFATVLGFDALYRLERLSGRYQSVSDERMAQRTVFDLAPAQAIDVWSLVRQYRERLPWVDALYGSATYLPMADGALYAISISTSGLLARPLNQAARDAVGGWR